MVGELKRLELVAGEESHVSDTLNTGNGSIDIWGIKDLELHDYAVNVLPKLKIGENKEMESFVLRKKEEVSMANIISMEDESIEIGRIKRKGFDVPEEIKPKLKYILIDKTEREIMEERAREIAKERKRKIMEERTREIANEKTREIAKEEKTKKGSFPSRVLKKILGRGRS
ncbi:MAG: uncharacterized protein A8A55_2716 [Amphiamblys sp. WSBS2006]|nr:MAG: uncharacterized protein A8A55_2716 [Amphiamblys sp. WSBS2006]